jgi:hypothetical protein
MDHHEHRDIGDEESLLGLEVRAFRCAACAVERWGGHVSLRVPEPLAFCFPCAKRLRLPSSVPSDDAHADFGGD